MGLRPDQLAVLLVAVLLVAVLLVAVLRPLVLLLDLALVILLGLDCGPPAGTASL